MHNNDHKNGVYDDNSKSDNENNNNDNNCNGNNNNNNHNNVTSSNNGNNGYDLCIYIKFLVILLVVTTISNGNF